MGTTPDPASLSYRSISPRGAGRYEVRYGDAVVGQVGRFQLSAGQFGSRWVATTPAGRRSGQYGSRDAAARWLLQQTRASDSA